MKKIISIILLLLVCISISGCNRYDDSYTEIWSCVNEFDIEGFDSNEFITKLQSQTEINLESSNNHYTEWVENQYVAVKGLGAVASISVCYDLNSAKTFFEEQKSFVSRIYTPYWSLVRINNVVFEPLHINQSNSIMPEIMSDLGIEDSYTLKIHNERQIFRSSTDKSLDEIVCAIENKGYKLFLHDRTEEYKVDSYSFISEDGTDIYEIIACHHEKSKNFVRGYLDWFYKTETDDTVTQIYYSFNDGYSMMFFGNSIETRDFWDEIR